MARPIRKPYSKWRLWRWYVWWIWQATIVQAVVPSLSKLQQRQLGSSCGVMESFPLQVEATYQSTSKAELSLTSFLMEQDPARFPSKNQVKKSCLYGRFAHQQNRNCKAKEETTEPFSILKSPFDTTIQEGDCVLFLNRVAVGNSSCYPVDVTNYLLPPASISTISVIYQDDNLALVHKPENMTTIGTARDDLQSCLGFLLRPPSTTDAMYHPRPVHRLDRRTSGLVLVAKSKDVMRELSAQFAQRQVVKTYVALVLLHPDLVASLPTAKSERDDKWNRIDYPIDGKEAISDWRLLSGPSPSSCTDGAMYGLLEVRPHHGRTHQIRRHLAYCLQSPIVGDAKYDQGAKKERTNGMYLCCQALEFHYPRILNGMTCFVPGSAQETDLSVNYDSELQRMRANIPLPDKFWSRIRAASHR